MRTLFARLPRLLPGLLIGLSATAVFAQAPASDPPAAAAAAPSAPLAKLELQEGDSIVFLGDSITHQCLYTQYVEDYFYTRFPKMRLKIHNAGVGGARAWDALQRFDKDVAAYKPKYVTILLGMNDGTYRPYDDATFQTYRQDMQKVVDEIRKIGATPILMTPTMFDARADRARPKNNRPAENTALYNSTLAYYGTWLREISVEQGCGFVNMWGPLNDLTLEQRKTNPTFTLIKDAVHPDAPGQVIMATSIIGDLSLKRQVGAIKVQVGNKRKPVGGSGGTASDVTASEEGVEFTWQAESLPWVIPAEGQEGAKLAKLGHRLSSESIEVHGLQAGKYTLTIDGKEVGTYTADQLARHVELQGNEKTPQYRQALKVAELNRERNNGPVKALRGEWGKFQGFARKRREAESMPDNAAVKMQLEQETKRVEGMDERVAAHNAKAKEIEDQIFAANVIPARKYVLKKVAE